ncbi:MAG: hypothetical protein MRY77_09725 [Rhodobacteraceae bacterium]|jgi:hypothetical protein|nr:hypothetical protein [Paracoccaceae bacterium]
MFNRADFKDASAVSIGTQQSGWASARETRQLDSEMAAMLRMHLHEDFSEAAGWTDLKHRLRQKGFYLSTQGRGLRLRDTHSHVDICSSRFLGFPEDSLERRFKAPNDQDLH